MTGFSETWLSLREGADTSARSVDLLARLRAWTQRHQVLHITDLGAGTGANLRYLAPRLGGEQVWVLVDNDPALLKALPALLTRWGHQEQVSVRIHADSSVHLDGEGFSARVLRQQRDLARPFSDEFFGAQHLVTASALLDLTSSEWINGLAQRLGENHSRSGAAEAAPGLACLFALSVDGRIEWQPSLDSDKRVTDLFKKHQQRDKGLGSAAGPKAGLVMADALRRVGFAVASTSSDWHLANESVAMQEALADGFLSAALEMTDDTEVNAKADLDEWRARRQQHLEAGQSTLMVGHVDVLALPRP